MVALGILASRLVGLVRLRVFGHFLGISDAADAFTAAFRIPNLLQNLFGEGALSASFIPVYARLVSSGDEAEASRLARSVASLLGLVVSLAVLLGVGFAPWLIDLIAPGFEGEKRELTIRLVRILWPGAGLLVLSAWCLGVLNSHGRFFLSYAAPVMWNVALIVALAWWGGRVGQADLVVVTAWASVVGSGLQVLVQLPSVLRLLRRLRSEVTGSSEHLKTVLRNFIPALTSRGVVQISAYIDLLIATFLPSGAPAAINYAQTLSNLPVSLFGMSVSAAELPRMAGASGDEGERAERVRERLQAGLRQISYFVVPTVGAFIALGHIVAAALFQTGRFSRADSLFVWKILAAAGIGLLASTLGRLYSSTFYALQDTKTPMRYALFRVAVGIGLGILFAVVVPRALGIEASWGAPGLALAGSMAAWLEFLLLRQALVARIGRAPTDWQFFRRIWLATVLAAVFAWGLLFLMADLHPLGLAAVVLGSFLLSYLSITLAYGVPEAQRLLARLRRRQSTPPPAP